MVVYAINFCEIEANIDLMVQFIKIETWDSLIVTRTYL